MGRTDLGSWILGFRDLAACGLGAVMVWIGTGARGGLESALPGEWAAFLLVLGGIAVIGVVILVAACLQHERVVSRRRARRRG